MATQDMTLMEFIFIKTLKGERIEIEKDVDGVKTQSFETIKTIQKLPQIQDVVIETEEGSKKTISIDKIYSWMIDVEKPRIRPRGHEKSKKRFRKK